MEYKYRGRNTPNPSPTLQNITLIQQLIEFPKFGNWDRIIAVKADLQNPNSYGGSIHDWTKTNMQRTTLNIQVKIRKAIR